MKHIGAAFAIVVAILCPSQLIAGQRPESGSTEATQIMRQVVTTYHSISSYSDRGTSVMHLKSDSGPFEIRIEFETLFKRPGKLRFYWTEESSSLPDKRRYVIWCDGEAAWESYPFKDKKPKRQQNLSMLVAGATGISQATAHEIPRLLTDEIRGLRLDQLKGYRIVGHEAVGNADCVVLAGNSVSGGELKVWVGRKDYLIRRIEETLNDGTRRDQLRTDIAVNTNIPNSRFAKKDLRGNKGSGLEKGKL